MISPIYVLNTSKNVNIRLYPWLSLAPPSFKPVTLINSSLSKYPSPPSYQPLKQSTDISPFSISWGKQINQNWDIPVHLLKFSLSFFSFNRRIFILDATIREPCQRKEAAHALSRSPPTNPTTNLDLKHHHVILTRSTFNIQRVKNASKTRHKHCQLAKQSPLNTNITTRHKNIRHITCFYIFLRVSHYKSLKK